MSDQIKDPDWTSLDAKSLREFLASDTGRKAVVYLTDTCPELMDGADVNKTLVRNGEVKGFTFAIRTLLELVHVQPETPKESPSYPSLDDESQWEDRKPKPTEPTN
jgi:hypothetical protein